MHDPKPDTQPRRVSTRVRVSARRNSELDERSWRGLPFLNRNQRLSICAAVIAIGLLLVTFFAVSIIPIPYVVVSPGQSTDLLDKGVVGVDGINREITGSLLLPGVAMTPQDGRVNLYQGLSAMLDSNSKAVLRESVYIFGKATLEQQATVPVDPTEAYRDAVVAGLTAAGRSVRPLPLVTSVASSGPSYGKLQTGDLITSVNSTVVSTRAELTDLVSALEPGTTVKVMVLRDSNEVELSIPTIAAQSDPTQSRLGIEVVTSYQYDDKVSVDISDSTAGNDAGLSVALAVYDRVSEESLINGRSVAAVGVVQPSGEVGQVTNLRQYIASAKRGGAEAMLIPASNCGDLSSDSLGISVIKVATVNEATQSLIEYTRDPESSSIPRC